MGDSGERAASQSRTSVCARIAADAHKIFKLQSWLFIKLKMLTQQNPLLQKLNHNVNWKGTNRGGARGGNLQTRRQETGRRGRRGATVSK